MFGLRYIFVCFLGCANGIISENQGKVTSVTFDPGVLDRGICQMPFTLKLNISVYKSAVTLHLHKTKDVDINAPVFWVIKTNNKFRVTKGNQPKIIDFAEYQDDLNGASITAKCLLSNKRSRKRFKFEGTLYINGTEYHLQPTNVTEQKKKQQVSQYKQKRFFDSGVLGIENQRHYKHKFRSRFRRENLQMPEYNVDVLVVVDYRVFRDWLSRSANKEETFVNIRKYFAHVINGVNLRYKSVVIDGYKINVHLVGYIVSQSPETSPWTELNKQTVDGKLQLSADKVLESLKDWVNSTQLPAHDHVMLFTGYDLFGDDGGSNYTTGLAFIGTMCQGRGRSVSVVEDHGGFQSVATAAHELGHSLGAEHDGDNNTCTPRDRYIMAGASFSASVANRYNPWHFSPCSVSYFTQYIHTMLNRTTEGACLKNKINPVDVPDVSNQMPGQLLKPDEQCRQMYGNQSYMCRGKNFGGESDICRAMFCRNPTTENKCILHTAARGTTCANKMWCINGMCVFDKNAPMTDDECLFGDQTGIVMKNRTCQQMVSEAAGYCYMDDFKLRCCNSCSTKYTGVPGCEFGDRVLQCNEAYCGRKFEDGSLYDVNCCGVCNYKPRITSTTTPTIRYTSSTPAFVEGEDCMDYSLIDNKPCVQHVNSIGRHACYDNEVLRRCCKTCETLKINTDKDCPWGDQKPKECKSLSVVKFSVCSQTMRKVCCASCDKNDKSEKPDVRDDTTDSTKGHNSGMNYSPNLIMLTACLFFLLVNTICEIKLTCC